VRLADTTAANPRKVGEWTLPRDIYRTNPNCNNTAVMHTSADLKPLHSVIYVKFPAGTGTVVFRALIKQASALRACAPVPPTTMMTNARARTPAGRAEQGQLLLADRHPDVGAQRCATELWCVCSHGPLCLKTEAAAPPATDVQVTRLAPVGVSCTDHCGTLGCSSAKTASLNKDVLAATALNLQQPCVLPLLASCNSAAPLVDANNFCSYNTPLSCGSSTTALSAEATSCDAVSTSAQRVCYCAPDEQSTSFIG
jgi:hypothetical protein